MRVLFTRLLFALLCVVTPASAAPVSFEVTIAEPEHPPDQSDEWLEYFGLAGAGATALGLAAPPLYASGLVVGGVLLLTGSLTMHGVEDRRWRKAVSALDASELPVQLRSALERRAAAAWPAQAGPGVAVDVTVNTWGLVATERDTACFVASLDLAAHRDDVVVVSDRIVIGTHELSPSAPPPQCATLSRFAADDGRLVKDAAAEAAEVLAALIIERLQREMP